MALYYRNTGIQGRRLVQYHKRCERVWCHPDDVGYVAEAEEDSDETQGDDDDEEEEEQKTKRNLCSEVIVLNSIELGAPTISRKRFCKQYRTTYQQIIPDEKNEAYSFAKKEFRKIRNTFDGVNDIALKLFKDFADINKNKYQNLDEIDTLRQSMNRKRDRYKDTEGGGDDKEDSLKEDSDDSIKDEEPPKKKSKQGRSIENPTVEHDDDQKMSFSFSLSTVNFILYIELANKWVTEKYSGER
ncbi:hypothetical protein B9Z55_003450 [Caenorhabditis nigoni]|uniref:Uncharacterized protein n=1 Tax=Caenorhabditis nigoni TaxID=1611254 RepID=A0A2G5VQB8_9PELO|nr:hypothetical protein B9Z55_003450 [Caenorhabditis nigoni]